MNFLNNFTSKSALFVIQLMLWWLFYIIFGFEITVVTILLFILANTGGNR